MTLGEQLRTARMRKGQTASEVAAATRMKVQHVEAIERNDFSAFSAPIYAKGFIRLMSEHLGVDPVPLVREYMQKQAAGKPPAPEQLKHVASKVTAPRPPPVAVNPKGIPVDSNARVLNTAAPTGKTETSLPPQPPEEEDLFSEKNLRRVEVTSIKNPHTAPQPLPGEAEEPTPAAADTMAPAVKPAPNPPVSLKQRIVILLAAAVVLGAAALTLCIRQCSGPGHSRADKPAAQEEIRGKMNLAEEPPDPYFD